jgi:SAM-dependent methyltransferase
LKEEANLPYGALERVRLVELQAVRPCFPHSGRVLEIGGGTGFQAGVLSDWGYQVECIDVAAAGTYFPITIYDGVHIPFDSSTFDCVFSSNVLEHVEPKKLGALLAETRRVLKSGAPSIHILPTSAWRFWTSASYYPGALRKVVDRLASKPSSAVFANAGPLPRSISKEDLGLVFRGLSRPFRAHGMYFSAAAELYYFSRKRWKRVFTKSGFHVTYISACGLFYSGNSVFRGLPISSRQHLSRYVGSSCNIFALE